MISVRSRDALAIKKAEGAVLGRPSRIPADVQARIVTAHAAGRSLSAIARALDADGIPTPSGSGRWAHPVVGGVIKRACQPQAVPA